MHETKNKKITLLEAFLICLTALYAPNIRFIMKESTLHGHQAGWLGYICSLLAFIPLLYVLKRLSEAFKGRSLHDILCHVFGNLIGKIISILYILWMVLLLALYFAYAAERLVTSAYVGTDVTIFFFLDALVVSLLLRYGIRVFSRMNKLIFAIGLTQFIIVLLAIFSNFSVENITPISTLDIVPILSTVPYIMTISSYVTVLFTFNDEIQIGRKSTGKYTFFAGFLTVGNTLMAFCVLGVFGFELGSKLNYPLNSAVINISAFQGSAGLESLFISIWIFIEFVTFSLFTYSIVHMIKNVFHLKNKRPIITAILGLEVFIAIYLCSNLFDLVKFSENIVVYVNLTLFFVIPVLLFFTAKLRKQIRRRARASSKAISTE